MSTPLPRLPKDMAAHQHTKPEKAIFFRIPEIEMPISFARERCSINEVPMQLLVLSLAGCPHHGAGLVSGQGMDGSRSTRWQGLFFAVPVESGGDDLTSKWLLSNV